MKPYYQGKAIRFPSKKDCHPKRGFKNWWESIGEWFSRRTMKQRMNRKIEENESLYTNEDIKKVNQQMINKQKKQ